MSTHVFIDKWRKYQYFFGGKKILSRGIFFLDVSFLGFCQSGPSCSKLTMSLVNDSLKF